MFGWFVSLTNICKAIYAKAQAGGLIKEKIVETVPEKVPMTKMSTFIISGGIYFSTDAWKVVRQVLEVKRGQGEWSCQVCDMDIQDDVKTSVACLSWFHFVCVGLKCSPKRKEWFCRVCFAK